MIDQAVPPPLFGIGPPIALIRAPDVSISMTPLDWLWLAALATCLMTLLVARWKRLAALLPLGYGLQFWCLSQTDLLAGQEVSASWGLRIFGHPVFWRYDSLSWFFALLAIGAGFVSSLLALPSGRRFGNAGEAGAQWARSTVTLATLTALILFGASDLLGLYLSWELAAWSLLPLLWLGGGLPPDVLRTYLLRTLAGGLALLGALSMLLYVGGSADFNTLRERLPGLDIGSLLMLAALLVAAIVLRLGALIVPVWKTERQQLSVAVFWSGAGARLGFFALFFMLARLAGGDGFADAGVGFRELLCWSSAIVVLIGGWRAWRGPDNRAMLGWLAFSQTGFVLLAFVVGGAFGSASGLLHLFSLALAEIVLWVICLLMLPTVSAAGERTMPWLALVAMGLAAASLIGLPPTLGFASKWLLYEALLSDPWLGWTRWLLLLSALLGGLFGAFGLLRLVDRRLLRFGGSPAEVPNTVMAPVLALSVLSLLAGILPGPALGWIGSIQQATGLSVLNWTLGGVAGRLDMRWVALWELLLLAPVVAFFWWTRQRALVRLALEAFWRLRDAVLVYPSVVEASRFAAVVRRLANRADGVRRRWSRSR